MLYVSKEKSKIFPVLLFLFIQIMFFFSIINAAIKTECPRIWLSEQKLSDLRAKRDASSSDWRAFINWCDNHLSTPESNLYSENENLFSTDYMFALNFALAYQVTGQADYGNKAITGLHYFYDNPYGGNINTDIQGNDYYRDRFIMPAFAIIYDWCYDLLADQEKASFGAVLKTWCDDLRDNDYWAKTVPANNYYSGHIKALASAVYAIHGDYDVSTHLDLLHTMLEKEIAYMNDESLGNWTGDANITANPPMGDYRGHAKGGEFAEGTGYGSNTATWAMEVIYMAYTAEGADYFRQTDFRLESIKYLINYGAPDGTVWAAGDDAVMEIDNGVKCQMAVAKALNDLKGGNADWSAYAQQWLADHGGPPADSWWHVMYVLWHNPADAAADYRTVISGADYDYYTDGGAYTCFMRNGWGSDATWIGMSMGGKQCDHGAARLGHFVLHSGGEYLVTTNYFLGDYALSAEQHNIIFMPETHGASYNDVPHWGTSTELRQRSGENYCYFAGNIGGIYDALPDYRHNDVVTYWREMSYFQNPDVLFIRDRLLSDDNTDVKQWQAYLPVNPSTSGNIAAVTNGSARMFLKVQKPASNYSLTAGSANSQYRLRTQDLSNTALDEMLHVLEPATTSQSSMTPTADIATIHPSFYGVHFQDPADPAVFVFDQNKAKHDTCTFSFSQSFTGTARILVSGLNEGNYAVLRDGAVLADYESVGVDAAGSLYFESPVSGAFSISQLSTEHLEFELISGNRPTLWVRPNPFNQASGVFITSQLHKAGKVRLDIINTKGQLVKTLINGNMVPGIRKITWNTATYTTGLYIVRLQTAKKLLGKRFFIIK